MSDPKMTFDLQAIGLSQDELQERVVESISRQVLSTTYMDEDGYPCDRDSRFRHGLEVAVKEEIDRKVDELATKHLLPKVASMVENLELQPTNRYGEKKGEPVSFIEHLVARAEAWMTEKVDYNGKDEKDGGYQWRARQTRIAYMINQHLLHNVEHACKAAIKDLNEKVAGGIEQTVKLVLKETLDKVKVGVK